MQDLYFFEVVWEVACLRDGKWQTGKCILRSAVQTFSDSLFRFGPDMVEVETPCFHPDPDGLVRGENKNALPGLSDSGYRNIQEEPRLVVASHGQRISEKQVLYELWEDSGLQVLAAEMFFIEPLIFCHAFKALLDHVRNELFSDAVAGSRKIDFLTAGAQLCVKKKIQRIETILSSEARISGENGMTFGMDLYGKLHHTFVPEQKVRYALLVPEEADFREKPIQAKRISDGQRVRVDAGGNQGITVRPPGEPERDYAVLPITPGKEEIGETAQPLLASGFLAHMNFYEEPSGLLWIF